MTEYEVNERYAMDSLPPVKEIASETKSKINDIFHQHSVLYRNDNDKRCEIVTVEFDYLHGEEIYKMLDLGFRINNITHAQYTNGRTSMVFYPVV